MTDAEKVKMLRGALEASRTLLYEVIGQQHVLKHTLDFVGRWGDDPVFVDSEQRKREVARSAEAITEWHCRMVAAANAGRDALAATAEPTHSSRCDQRMASQRANAGSAVYCSCGAEARLKAHADASREALLAFGERVREACARYVDRSVREDNADTSNANTRFGNEVRRLDLAALLKEHLR